MWAATAAWGARTPRTTTGLLLARSAPGVSLSLCLTVPAIFLPIRSLPRLGRREEGSFFLVSACDASDGRFPLVNRILGSCTSLMQAIQVLIVASKDLQREIVESGRVSRAWGPGTGRRSLTVAPRGSLESSCAAGLSCVPSSRFDPGRRQALGALSAASGSGCGNPVDTARPGPLRRSRGTWAGPRSTPGQSPLSVCRVSGLLGGQVPSTPWRGVGVESAQPPARACPSAG